MNSPYTKAQKLQSVLGIALDGARLHGVVVRRGNGVLSAQQQFSISLSLDPLTADPELVGREIRNHLDAAGIREKFCVVGIPLKWALTAQVEIPALPESEVEGFLQIEAERNFHADINTLHYGVSRVRLLSGKQQALLAGVPKNHLLALERAFVNARVKPVSFSVGIIALQPPVPDSAPGVLA